MTPSPTNYSAWQFYLNIVVALGVVLNTGYTWLSNRKKGNDKRFTALEASLDSKIGKEEANEYLGRCTAHREQTDSLENQVRATESALQLLEQEIKYLPSSTEIQQLNSNMVSVAEKMGKLEGRLDSVDRTLGLMNEFLINQGGK